MIDRDRVREALTGPLTSISTPFNRDGSVDYDSLRRALDFNIEAGSKTMLLTAGDSHYIVMSDEEITDVSKAVVEHTAGRAMVVTADRYYHTRQAVEFAKYAAAIGSDVHMVLPPDWAASCTAETLCDHYAAIAEHIPVMIVTGVFIPRGEEFGLKTLEKVLNRVENVVAIKDDMQGRFARRMTLLLHEHWAVFSGGEKQNHLNLHPYGCHGYMSTFLTFKPEIAHNYWRAIEADDIPTASSIIHDFDLPFFDLLKETTGGFDAAIHGVLEIYGICRRWRPPPYYSLSDADMEALEDGIRGLGLL